jgi:uncharacterized repeat protein (TIGR01451 family)
MNAGVAPAIGKRCALPERCLSGPERGSRTRAGRGETPLIFCGGCHEAARFRGRKGLFLTMALLVASAAASVRSAEAVVRPAADLVVTMLATPLNVPVGDRIEYRIAVTNQGPDLATGVVLVDPLPAGLEFVSANTSQGASTLSQQTLLSNMGALVVGQTVVVNLIVTTTVAGQFRNGATVHSETPDPNLDNNVAFYPASAGPQPPPPLDVGGSPCAIAQSRRAVLVVRGMLTFNPITRRFLQQVQVGNIAKQPISGPFWLVLDGLAPVLLTNADGKTICRAPLDSPYIQINVGADGVLRPQEVVTMTLSFAIPAGKGLRYSTRVLTGTGER